MSEEDKDQNPQAQTDPLTIGKLISLAEAAQLSKLNQAFLSQIAKTGRLKAQKIGRNYVTTIAAIEEYLSSRHRGKKIS